MQNRRLIVMGMVAAWLAAPARAASPTYDAAATRQWRAAHEAELKSPNGWLTIAGLTFLKPGENTVGADPLSDVPLPAGNPARVGVVVYEPPRRVVLNLAAGVAATAGGRPVAGQFDFTGRAGGRAADRVSVDQATLELVQSGARVGIRIREPQRAERARFTGLEWYPVDAAWNVPARFIPYDLPKTLPNQNVLGDDIESVSPGEVEAAIGGATLRLVLVRSGNRLSITFSDGTSGRETYRLRTLTVDPPGPDGRLHLDFNRAANPPCAFSPHTTCPLPLPPNRLKVPITAGAKRYDPARGSGPSTLTRGAR